LTAKSIAKLNDFVSIDSMRENKKLQKKQLLQRGNRLSVMPITKDELDEIIKMGK
jgi:predicted RNA-binding protein with PUA-like domain